MIMDARRAEVAGSCWWSEGDSREYESGPGLLAAQVAQR